MPRTEKAENDGIDLPAIPKAKGEPRGGAENKDLLDAQRQLFTPKSKKEPAAEQQQTTEAKPPAPSRSQELVDKANAVTDKIAKAVQQKTEKTETEEKATEEGEFEGSSPFVDMSAFLDKEGDSDDGQNEEEEQSEEETPPAPDIDLDKENNIKNLRQAAGKFKHERDTYQTKISQLETELKNRPDTNALQNEVIKLKERIEQLQPYETIFALHQNPEFKKQFIDGSNQLVSEMQAIAKDYGVDEDVIQDILQAKNRRELDEILEQSFSKDAPRQELKALRQKWDGIQREKVEFEKKPQESLAEFERRKEELEAAKNQKRQSHFERIANDAWMRAITDATELPDDKKIYELVEVPGKKDHNEKVVRPTLNTAKQLMTIGALHIERMIRSGSLIDKKFMAWFATICQQAAATQMVHHSRLGMYQKYQELLEGQKKQRSFDRPGITTPSTHASSNNGSSDKKGKSGTAVSAQIFMDVMNRDV